MKETIFPADFPSHLAQDAFLTENEAAWPIASCPAVIEWLRSHGFAVLGTELWVVIDGEVWAALRTRRGSEIHGNSCELKPGEAWTDYVVRCAKEAREAIEAFSWPDDATVGKSSDVRFNLTWVDRAWFGAAARK